MFARQFSLPGLILAVSTAASAQGTVYTWFDDEGRVVYGDEPPVGITARPLDVQPPPPPSPPPAATVFLWMDEEGRAQYGAEPPAGVSARAVELPPIQVEEVSGPAPQAVYTWRDVTGRVHYGSDPPPGVEAETVDFSRQPVTTINAGRLRPAEVDALREFDLRREQGVHP